MANKFEKGDAIVVVGGPHKGKCGKVVAPNGSNAFCALEGGLSLYINKSFLEKKAGANITVSRPSSLAAGKHSTPAPTTGASSPASAPGSPQQETAITPTTGVKVSAKSPVVPPKPVFEGNARLRAKLDAAKKALEDLRHEAYAYCDDSHCDSLPLWVEEDYGAVFADVASIVIENIHQKRDEVIYAAEHPEFTVSRSTIGADLLHKVTSVKRELKVARVTTKNKRANFSFSFKARANGETDAAFRSRVAKSIYNKIEKGDAVFIIKDGLGRLQKEYTVSGLFLHSYVMQKSDFKEKTRSLNFGAPVCRNCGECHRLEKLHRYSAKEKDPLELRKEDWKDIFAATPAHCGAGKMTEPQDDDNTDEEEDEGNE